MYLKYLKDYVIHEDEDIYKAHWKLFKNGAILIVLDLEEKYKGLITFKDIKSTYENQTLSIRQICNAGGEVLVWP